MEALHLMRAGSRTSPDRDPLHDPLERYIIWLQLSHEQRHVFRNGTLVVSAMGGLAFVYLLVAGAEANRPILFRIA